MECPDIYKLLDFAENEASAADLPSHVHNCASCRAQLRVIRELPAAYRPEFEVPEILVQRVMATVRQATPTPVEERAHVHQRFVAGVLGATTASVAVVATGSMGEETTAVELMLFAILAGLASAFVQGSEIPSSR